MNNSNPLSAIRLFISSTFADMQPERDCFNDILVTKLGALCRDRGVSFFGVDLRWGVTGEDIANVDASAMWNLQLQPNDCVKCMAFVHADHPALLSVAYSKHAKFLMKVMEDLDALAAR